MDNSTMDQDTRYDAATTTALVITRIPRARGSQADFRARGALSAGFAALVDESGADPLEAIKEHYRRRR